MSTLSSLAEAYAVLGLTQGCPLDEVKSRYRQVALRTHPDKNPDNPDATVEFQRVSEAYRIISAHADSENEDGFCGDSDLDDYDSDDEIPLEVYLWLYSRFMGGRMEPQNSCNHGPYRQQAGMQPEDREKYRERLRRTMEERRQAEERRKREDEARKQEEERRRETERQQAEERRQQKRAAKKSQAKAKAQKAEQTAQKMKERAQTLRSNVFQAAREKKSAKVKDGIDEFSVDANGGEVRTGCEEFVKIFPDDPRETLSHIATKNGDADLVEYLDRHGAEPEERDSNGFTPVHLAVREGNLSIVTYFFETYPPKDTDHTIIYNPSEGQNILAYALRSLSPQMVDLILSNHLASTQDIQEAWDWAISEGFMADINKDRTCTKENGNLKDILALLLQYGDITFPSVTESVNNDPEYAAEPSEASFEAEIPDNTGWYASRENNKGRGQGRDRGKSQGRAGVRGGWRGRHYRGRGLS
ncbi:hypothetical protein F5887DRAFT_1126209 [Amanita rubescens]|nr:hypothetical protein F5887DRAFT_1126209 [Amanita rubescens]